MRDFFTALQFLTIIPTGRKTTKEKFSLSMIYFPLVGLFLGLILALVSRLFYLILFPQLLSSVVLVTLLVILTGGLHLDGLADTFDAFSSSKTPQEMLKIMKDSHIGTMGVLSLICILLLKVSLLTSLNMQARELSLISMCLLSRYVLVLAIFSFDYAREKGKAQIFFASKNNRILLSATTITLVFAFLLLGLKGVVVFLGASGFSLLVGKWIAKKINGITGDSLGAINELTEVFVLFIICIVNGFWSIR